MKKRANVSARAKARRSKATKPNRRNIPKADLRTQSKPSGEKVARLTRERDEALQQQAATSEVLKIIRHSPADTKPVFDAIVESAALLSGAIFSVLYLYDGDRMSIGATSNFNIKAIGRIQEIQQLKRPERSHLAGRAILERAIVHVPDVLADRSTRANWRWSGDGGRCFRFPCCAKEIRWKPFRLVRRSQLHFQTDKFNYCRPSRTKPSSPSRTCGCSMNSGNRWSSKLPRRRCLASSVQRLATCRAVFAAVLEKAVRILRGPFRRAEPLRKRCGTDGRDA